jgi:DNA alkylation repair enzyme.
MPAIKKTKQDLPTPAVKKLNPVTARVFLENLSKEASVKTAAENKRFYHVTDATPNKFLGVRMKTVFDLSKKYMNMTPAEIEKLLDSPVYEARLGAVSIMDFQARDKKTTEETKKRTLRTLYPPS